ncbi:MAG TPA: ABC transporter permease [Conexibacter sp.]|nr:ABC transporter permease [Conexibacter sp.]
MTLRKNLSRGLLGVFALLVVLFLIAPTVIVIITSFGSTRSLAFPPKGFSLHWYGNVFTSEWMHPIFTSLKVAVGASVLATLLGTCAALAIVRGRFPGRRAVQALTFAPLIVPTVIVAIGIYAVFSRWHLIGSIWGLVFAHTALGIPFVVVVVSASLQTLDPMLDRASASLGAGRFTTFARVTLPLILPAVLTGAVLAFVTSLDEVVIALFLTTPDVNTLPVHIWATLQDFIDPTIAAISGLLFAITALALASTFALRRKAEVHSDL